MPLQRTTRGTTPLKYPGATPSGWLSEAATRAQTIDSINWQKPGELLPQATINTSARNAVSRPFPQAFVYASHASKETVPIFPQANARNGINRIKITPPTMAEQYPSMKKSDDAGKPKMSTTQIIGWSLLGVGIVVVIVMLVR